MEIARVVATARKKGFAGFLFGKQVSYEFSCIHVSLRASLVGKRFVAFILENSVKPQITALAVVNAVWRKVWGRRGSPGLALGFRNAMFPSCWRLSPLFYQGAQIFIFPAPLSCLGEGCISQLIVFRQGPSHAPMLAATVLE
jgi:hypothetical protein